MGVISMLKEQRKKREQDLEEVETKVSKQERRLQEIEIEVAAGQDDEERQTRLDTAAAYLSHLKGTERQLKEEKAKVEFVLQVPSGGVPRGIFVYRKADLLTLSSVDICPKIITDFFLREHSMICSATLVHVCLQASCLTVVM